MEIYYKVDKDEFIDFHKNNYSKTGMYFFQISFMYIILIAIFIKLLTKGMINTIYEIVFAVIIFALLGFLSNKAINYFVEKNLLFKYKNFRYAYLFNDIKLVTDDETISIETIYGYEQINYNAIKDMYINNKYISIYLNNGEILYIPISAFEGEYSKKQFIEEIIQRSSVEAKYKYPFNIGLYMERI